MNKQQKSNLAKTAIKLLQDASIKFDMGYFVIDPDGDMLDLKDVKDAKIDKAPECGTSCCFAGYGPIALHNATHYKTWTSYTEGSYDARDTGDVEESLRWHFLFSDGWASDKKQAAARAVVLLENGGVVPERAFEKDSKRYDIGNDDSINYQTESTVIDYDKRYLTKLSIKQLIARLEPFIYNRKR